MCKKLISVIDEDVRLGLKKKFRLISDMCEWVPNFIDGLIGAITG